MSTKRPPLCIYHGPACVDGFAAAWALNKYYRDHTDIPKVDFHVGVYGEPIPDVVGRLVFIVDFSYDLESTKKIIDQAEFTVILDHHKTAVRKLEGFPRTGEKHYIELDMTRSGAMMTWDYFFKSIPAPKLIHYVQDRDLWTWKIPETKAVSAAIYSYPFKFEIWDELAGTATNRLIREGEVLLRKQEKDIATFLPLMKRPVSIAGYDVFMAGLPPSMASDVGQILAEENLFGVIYFDTKTHREFSLRSIKGKFDVEEVAVVMGGGGHPEAAGFRVPRNHRLAQA